jgi:hypothetical protein
MLLSTLFATMLAAQKVTVPTIVVEHAEKATEN